MESSHRDVERYRHCVVVLSNLIGLATLVFAAVFLTLLSDGPRKRRPVVLQSIA